MLVAIVIIFCIIAVILACLTIWLKQPKTIGKIGEKAVSKVLRRQMDTL